MHIYVCIIYIFIYLCTHALHTKQIISNSNIIKALDYINKCSTWSKTAIKVVLLNMLFQAVILKSSPNTLIINSRLQQSVPIPFHPQSPFYSHVRQFTICTSMSAGLARENPSMPSKASNFPAWSRNRSERTVTNLRDNSSGRDHGGEESVIWCKPLIHVRWMNSLQGAI